MKSRRRKKAKGTKKIALEASQQSGRGIVPEIMDMTELKKAVENDESELKILFYEGGGESLKSIIPQDIKKCICIYRP